MKKKIAIIGVGGGGCVTALHYFLHGQNDFEIDIYYDPYHHPIEKVGQGTTRVVTDVITKALKCNWYDNPLNATIKTGILYENWGKKQKEIFHPFYYMAGTSMHFTPTSLANEVVNLQDINGDVFNVKEQEINDPEKEIDADYIFDCRGKDKRNLDLYEKLISPINSVLLCRSKGVDNKQIYTRSIATKNGWAFIIPDTQTTSFGYLYNNNITTEEEAKKDFFETLVLPNAENEFRFEGGFSFDNYIAKSMFTGERTILNGNRYAFLEPLEATSLASYLTVAKSSWNHIVDGISKEDVNKDAYQHVKEVERFILWHYQRGSIYDTPFWEYAKSLPFETDATFESCIASDFGAIKEYGQWDSRSFQIWEEGTNGDN